MLWVGVIHPFPFENQAEKIKLSVHGLLILMKTSHKHTPSQAQSATRLKQFPRETVPSSETQKARRHQKAERQQHPEYNLCMRFDCVMQLVITSCFGTGVDGLL